MDDELGQSRQIPRAGRRARQAAPPPSDFDGGPPPQTQSNFFPATDTFGTPLITPDPSSRPNSAKPKPGPDDGGSFTRTSTEQTSLTGIPRDTGDDSVRPPSARPQSGRPPSATVRPPSLQQQSSGGGAPPSSPPGGGGGNDDDDDDRPPPPRRAAYEEVKSPTPPSGPADPFAEEGKKWTGVSRRKQVSEQKAEEERVRGRSKYDDLANNAEAILEIPELEEEGKEDLSRVVAEAPKVRVNKVQGMAELDDDMQYRLPSNDDRDIDLSLLTAVLCASEQVHEADEAWDPDMLLTDVASDLNREKEKMEGGGEEGPKDEPAYPPNV